MKSGPRDGSGGVGSWHKAQDVSIWQDGHRVHRSQARPPPWRPVAGGDRPARSWRLLAAAPV